MSAATRYAIRAGSAEAAVVSRPEATDLIGRCQLAGWSTPVLHRRAEETEDDQASVRALDEFTAVVPGPGQPEEQDGPDQPDTGTVVRLGGLQAKMVLRDLQGEQ